MSSRKIEIKNNWQTPNFGKVMKMDSVTHPTLYRHSSYNAIYLKTIGKNNLRSLKVVNK